MNDITNEILGAQPPQAVAQPPAPPPAPAIIAVGEQSGASNRRPADKNERAAQFRSALSSATFDGLAQSISTDIEHLPPVASSIFTRSEKTPRAEPPTLSAAESAGLYNAAKASDWNSAVVSAHRIAATKYAKSFFSVEGTYARPGEALEIKA